MKPDSSEGKRGIGGGASKPGEGSTDRPAEPVRSGKSSATWVVLTGNPNCGKTTLFNALTGLRARVGNYSGVTVERKEGALLNVPAGTSVTVLDLPGTYSLSAQSLDEKIARDVLLERLPEVPSPDLVVVVVDASNLQRNLYYATQVIEVGHPTVVALNMVDVARANGHEIAVDDLSRALGTPVFPMSANTGEGIEALRQHVIGLAQKKTAGRAGDAGAGGAAEPRYFCELPELFGREAAALAKALAEGAPGRRRLAPAESLLRLMEEPSAEAGRAEAGGTAEQRANEERWAGRVREARARLESEGVDWRSVAIESRYARAAAIQMAVTRDLGAPGETVSDRIDRVVTHRVWGVLIFLGIMALMFQTIFGLADVPMGWMEAGVGWLAGKVEEAMSPGALRDLLSQGVIAGVGAVVVFLPQICLLFLFISLLEDSGYMARAAFLMDRVMSRVGLHGKSFIPMLSSFACAIPGIMATRTIESPKDRLATILVAPLMSCSARLPVYALLIAACVPDRRLGGWIGLKGLTLLGMYLLGIVGALGMAWLLKRTLLRGEPPPLILELPPYKRPVLKVVIGHMWDRSKLFLRRAGTVILGINILLWFLANYPGDAKRDVEYAGQRAAAAREFGGEWLGVTGASGASISAGATNVAVGGQVVRLKEALGEDRMTALRDRFEALQRAEAGEKLRGSYAGWTGRAIEPLIRPLGFDWKIGIGLVASFAAREVFVSTMSVVYNASGGGEGGNGDLAETLRNERHPSGAAVYTTLTGVTLMVFYVFALQCVSTVAVVRRETNSWKWPIFQWFYMTGLAWVAAYLCYQVGRSIGMG